MVIAEDYGAMATALTRLLTPDCDVVETVIDGRGAVDAAQRLLPDVMLIDLNLPDMSGLEVCRSIAQSNRHTKMIIITGLVDPTMRSLALAAGASAFISKADAGSELLAAIKKALAAS